MRTQSRIERYMKCFECGGAFLRCHEHAGVCHKKKYKKNVQMGVCQLASDAQEDSEPSEIERNRITVIESEREREREREREKERYTCS